MSAAKERGCQVGKGGRLLRVNLGDGKDLRKGDSGLTGKKKVGFVSSKNHRFSTDAKGKITDAQQQASKRRGRTGDLTRGLSLKKAGESNSISNGRGDERDRARGIKSQNQDLK